MWQVGSGASDAHRHVALAIVAGLIGALAISLIAGSRRSSTAVDRYFDTAPGYDVLVGSPSLNREQLLAVDGVDLVAPSAYLALNVVGDEGKASPVDGLIVDFSQPDGTRQVIRGALPGADEYGVAVDESFPAVFGVDAGDTVRVQMCTPDQLDEVIAGVYDPRGPTYDFTVAAIGRIPQVIAQDETRITAARRDDAVGHARADRVLERSSQRVPRLRSQL